MFWALGTFGPSMLGPWLFDQELQEVLQELLQHTQRQLDTTTPQVCQHAAGYNRVTGCSQLLYSWELLLFDSFSCLPCCSCVPLADMTKTMLLLALWLLTNSGNAVSSLWCLASGDVNRQLGQEHCRTQSPAGNS